LGVLEKKRSEGTTRAKEIVWTLKKIALWVKNTSVVGRGIRKKRKKKHEKGRTEKRESGSGRLNKGNHNIASL